MQTHAIIVSAGKGVRMNRSTPKQYLLLQGRPVLCHTIMAFNECPEVDNIVLVVPEKDIRYCRDQLLSGLNIDTPVNVLAGGNRRQDSVFNGILSIDGQDGIVVVHDGVRPLIRPEMISRCINKARITGACILGVSLHDTLKIVNNDSLIQGTIARKSLWAAQTPQAFHYQLIRDAHEAAANAGFETTDDAALLEWMGLPVSILQGTRDNFKITTNEDLVLAEAILPQTKQEK
ncbi:MAG: 2-C-methyl-D-erythritol 4-phosphate cytidylyltransferase [Desulfobacterales bacterium]|nr:2-C-methyl-D-erythritol 4-phosphate cytidylyltransferase [Desulfobacterales bacterium]MDX2511021.1 2-C-methyl-D-erythritol 4-phosphate cytidylyltransferase [Desulfobacterales bacterium]